MEFETSFIFDVLSKYLVLIRRVSVNTKNIHIYT